MQLNSDNITHVGYFSMLLQATRLPVGWAACVFERQLPL